MIKYPRLLKDKEKMEVSLTPPPSPKNGRAKHNPLLLKNKFQKCDPLLLIGKLSCIKNYPFCVLARIETPPNNWEHFAGELTFL